MNRSSKLKNIFDDKNQDLLNDSETDISSISDNRNISTINLLSTDSEISSDENSEISRENCCLICSILPNLSNINTCQKHLTLLTKSINSTKIVHIMNPRKNDHQSKFKHRYRSSSYSSSSSSSEFRHQPKRRSMIVQSSDSSSQDYLFFSPNVQSQKPTNVNQQYQSIHIQTQLSPSLPPSSTMYKTLQQYNEILLTPLFKKQSQENNNEIQTILKDIQNKPIQQEVPQINHKINSPDVFEIDSNLSNSSYISLNRSIHEKGDSYQKKITIDKNQLIEQILTNKHPQPIILLERVCFER
ncbi:unnamed protein product [Rotaria sordida]|uniref:Uncharacterized protein n=1 Tax=Rotaria sordida TaxID=392033 RepID=A0A814YID5_9BILA|nr:unnamed protein product [Rotaria sordida]CAF1229506.1 unnamed protein product [Rotaria sordida]